MERRSRVGRVSYDYSKSVMCVCCEVCGQDRHVGIDTLVPPLHLINGCVRKQPPFQAPQTFQNKQLMLSGLLSIRAAAENECARARSLSPRFCFPCNLPFSLFISSLSIHHSDNHLVFHPAIVAHLKLMSLSLFGVPFYLYDERCA